MTGFLGQHDLIHQKGKTLPMANSRKRDLFDFDDESVLLSFEGLFGIIYHGRNIQKFMSCSSSTASSEANSRGANPESDITTLFAEWNEGDATTLDRLAPIVYDELLRLA